MGWQLACQGSWAASMDGGGTLRLIVFSAMALAIVASEVSLTVTMSQATSQSAILTPSTTTAMTSTEIQAVSSDFSSVIMNNAENYTFSQLTTSTSGLSLYMAKPTGCAGWVYYLGIVGSATSGTPVAFTCDVTLYIPTAPFTCAYSNGTQLAAVNAPAASTTSGSGGWTMEATVNGTAASSVMSDGLMSWVLNAKNTWQNSMSTIHQSNADRHKHAKGYVAGIYFLIGVGMLETVIIAVCWMTWTWQPIKSDKDVPGEWSWRNWWLWFGILFVSQNLISIFGGFMAWCVVGVFLLFYIFVMNACIFPYLRYKCKCCCPDKDLEAAFKQPSQPDASASAGSIPLSENVVSVDNKDQVDSLPADAGASSSSQGIATASPGSVELWGRSDWSLHDTDFKILCGAYLMFLLTGFIILIVALPGWTNAEYQLWDRMNFATTGEYQPEYTGKALQMMYAYDRLATNLKMNTFAVMSTDYCGTSKTKYLEPSERSEIYDDWIEPYSINMAEYDPQDYNQYDSANHWFIRSLASGARSICSVDFPNTFPGTLVAPADARVMAWQTSMDSTRYWIKNTDVDVATMLGSVPSTINGVTATFSASTWSGGPLVVFRLAPQDYHRFHSPVSGTVLAVWEEGGTILSVSADAATSDNGVFLNSRKVIIIDTTCCGKVAYIAIGATCVGSVVLYTDEALTTQLAVGDTVTAGSQLGIMQFGGSTVVMLYETGRIQVDQDILDNTGTSDKYAETYMQMGEPFARY